MNRSDDRGVHSLWDFRTGGNIWRIVPAEGRLIAGEERNLEKKTVTFFCVALDDGRALWKGKSIAESWWTGIETTHRGILFIHGYPAPSMPDHKKILALDALSGDSLWENGELAFGFASGASVYASKELFDRRAFFELDLMTGSVVREVPADELHALRAAPGAPWGLDVQLPGVAAEPPEAVRSAFPAESALEPGETLRYNDADVSNWYEVRPGDGTGRKLREHLFVLDARTGELRYRDVVCDGLSLPAGSTFFRVEERVLYVKDRTTLRSFSLSNGDTK